MTLVAGPIRAYASPREETVERGEETVERAIVEAIAYADVFDWPLTGPEVHRFLPVRAEPGDVERAIDSPRLRGITTRTGGYLTLAGRERLVGERGRHEAASSALWSRAMGYIGLVARLPFVRLVAVTGSLAVGSAGRDADVDLFIVTEDRRLWLARAMTNAIVRVAAARSIALCPNYLVAESAMTLADRDLFTAHEFVQMVPLAGDAALSELLARNHWYREFLPNHPGPESRVRIADPGTATRWAERVLRSPVVDRLERWEMRRKIRKLTATSASRGGPGDETRFDADTCKGHAGQHRRRSLEAHRQRLTQVRAETR